MTTIQLYNASYTNKSHKSNEFFQLSAMQLPTIFPFLTLKKRQLRKQIYFLRSGKLMT
jgi:hypothetical protein